MISETSSPPPRRSARPAVHADAEGREARPRILYRQIDNGHTRKAYLNPTRRFAEWCDEKGILQLAGL